MDLQEFVDGGYLQEVNRSYLHLLGLALEVVRDSETGKVLRLGGIWDFRDDPEGLVFGPGEISMANYEKIRLELEEKRENREKNLGFWVQMPS